MDQEDKAQGRLNRDDKADLRDLVTHPGFRLYQAQLRDHLHDLKASEHSSKTWEEFIKYSSRVDLLELTVIPMVRDMLEED